MSTRTHIDWTRRHACISMQCHFNLRRTARPDHNACELPWQTRAAKVKTTNTRVDGNMQPRRPQHGALSGSLCKASSKPERCSQAKTQPKQTFNAYRKTNRKEHQDKSVTRQTTVFPPKLSHKCLSIQSHFNTRTRSETPSQREQSLGDDKGSNRPPEQDVWQHATLAPDEGTRNDLYTPPVRHLGRATTPLHSASRLRPPTSRTTIQRT